MLHSRADGNVHGTTSTPTNSPQRVVTADGSKVIAKGPLRAGDSPPEQQVNAIAVLLEGRFGKLVSLSVYTVLQEAKGSQLANSTLCRTAH